LLLTLYALLFVFGSFPGGESYRDLIRRLGSVVIEVEQQVIPTLVVSHVSILQVLIAYFRNSRIESCMNIEVPLHTVIKFTPVRGGGWMEERIPLTGESPVVGGGVGGSSSSVGSIGGVGVGGGGGCVGNSSISNTNSKVGTTTLVPVQSNSEISALGMEEAPMSPIWGDHCSSRSRMYSLEHVRGFPASPTYT
jgi:Histidine phosphatase superfamily (branch 1)